MDLLDKGGLERVFQHHGGFRACIHFAGLKAVGESVAKPLSYYDNNLTGTLNLLDAMRRHGCGIIGACAVGPVAVASLAAVLCCAVLLTTDRCIVS